MRWDIRCHPHSNTRRAINKEVGDSGGQNGRNSFGPIVIVDKVDRFFIEIRKQSMGNLSHADFGVTHGSRGVTVDRPEVSLTIHQWVAQGKILCHSNDGVVDRRVAVGVVFTNDITHDPR